MKKNREGFLNKLDTLQEFIDLPEMDRDENDKCDCMLHDLRKFADMIPLENERIAFFKLEMIPAEKMLILPTVLTNELYNDLKQTMIENPNLGKGWTLL